jgi:hypothetical protein
MELKNSSTINLTQKEIKDIQQFCNLNKIEDIPTFLRDCTWKGYEIEKFGLLGKTGVKGGNPRKTGGEQEKWVEKEVIREKRVEIPVEVIKEVIKIEYVEIPVEKIVEVIKEVHIEKIVEKPIEIIKEVPVEKVVIKEIPVEKIVTIYDNSSENELLLKIQQLESEKQIFSTKTQELEGEVRKFSTITTEMENIFHNIMSKKDEELNELRHSLDKPPIQIIKEVLVQDTTALDELLLERSILKNKVNELENTSKDNSKQKALEETIQKLRTELQLKNKEINDLKNSISEIQTSQGRQGIFLDGSNLNRTVNRK